MFTVATLLKRKPGLGVAEFQHYWRHRHAPLVAAQAGVRRYVQSHALLQGYRKGELLFDGVSQIWFDSEAAYQAYAQERTKIEADEHSFTDPACSVVMPLDVHVIKAGPIPVNAVKNIEFVNRRPGMPLQPFRDYWRNVHGPIASRIAEIARYEQHHVQGCAYEADTPPRYDGLAITWFASTSDMRKGATTTAYAATRADEPNFLPDGHLPIIITREQVVVGERGA